MDTKNLLEFTENKRFKIILLLALLIVALLYLYFYRTDIENVPDSIRYSGYTQPTFLKFYYPYHFFRQDCYFLFLLFKVVQIMNMLRLPH